MKSLSIVIGIILSVFINAQSAQAKSADAFFKRFQIVRSADGKLIGIRDRSLTTNFSVIPYVKMVKSQLLNEQSLMKNESFNGDYEQKVKAVLNEGQDFNFSDNQAYYDENVNVVVDSLKQLAAVNVEVVFNNPEFKNVLELYSSKLTEALLLLDPTMVANASDSTYFYKKNVSYKVVSWALDFARKRLSSVPLLNTASHVIVTVENLINERRQFHQNMLLHYLENFKEEELGLTHDEVNLIWSSIYESRIQWFAFWESNAAKANWSKYGVTNFYQNYRLASATMRSSQPLYSEIGERMNFSFQKVTFNNEKVVINLFDKESMFQNRPAVAFNYDKPTQIVRKRILLNLADLGLSFLPVSAFIKDTASSFIKSFYAQQKITEGALYGYFESVEDPNGQKQVKNQYLNPFDGLAI